MVKMTRKQKNKVTFIYPTFKVGTIKVVLFFRYTAALVIFLAIFSNFLYFSLKKQKMANIWPQRQNFEKIRPLYFMILKKL